MLQMHFGMVQECEAQKPETLSEGCVVSQHVQIRDCMFQLDPETEDRSLPLLFVSSPDSQCILDSRLFTMPIFNSGESLSVYQLSPKLSHAENRAARRFAVGTASSQNRSSLARERRHSGLKGEHPY